MQVHLAPFSWISLPLRSPQSAEESPPCYDRFSLVTCFVHDFNVSLSISDFIPPPLPPFISICLFSTSVSLLRFIFLDLAVSKMFLEYT